MQAQKTSLIKNNTLEQSIGRLIYEKLRQNPRMRGWQYINFYLSDITSWSVKCNEFEIYSKNFIYSAIGTNIVMMHVHDMLRFHLRVTYKMISFEYQVFRYNISCDRISRVKWNNASGISISHSYNEFDKFKFLKNFISVFLLMYRDFVC